MNKIVAVAAVLALCLAVVSAKKHIGGPKAHELTASYSFEQYKRDFHKVYRSAAEHDRRAKNFARSLTEVLQHNAKEGMLYKKGVNKFSDWDEIELARLRGGRHDPTMKTKSASGFVSSGLKALPSSLDYRQHFPPVLTAVKDQGQCGDCWAHSVTEAIESSYAMLTGQLFVLSQQQVTACTPQYGSCYSCDGNYPVLAYEYAVENGITEEWIYPFSSYTGNNVNCSATPYIQTPVNTIVNISGYTMVGNNSQEDFVSALNELGPLSILVDASSWSSYESGIFNGCDYSQNISLDHAVQVVGYGEENGTEYWIVRNSWAASWGELGFIRLLKTRVPQCGWNVGAAYPSDCTGSGPSATWSCGECGILFSPTFPTATPASSSSQGSSSGVAPSSGSGSVPSSGSGSVPSSGSGSVPSSGSGSIPSSGSGSIPSSGSASSNSGSQSGQFVVYGVGASFPNPPSGYALATLAAVQSSAFVNQYNSGLLTDLNQTMAGCCVFQLQDGYLQVNNTFVVPYTQSGGEQCFEQLTNPVYFGTLSTYTIANPLVASQLSASSAISGFCGGVPQNTFAIFQPQQ